MAKFHNREDDREVFQCSTTAEPASSPCSGASSVPIPSSGSFTPSIPVSAALNRIAPSTAARQSSFILCSRSSRSSFESSSGIHDPTRVFKVSSCFCKPLLEVGTIQYRFTASELGHRAQYGKQIVPHIRVDFRDSILMIILQKKGGGYDGERYPHCQGLESVQPHLHRSCRRVPRNSAHRGYLNCQKLQL